MKTDHIKNIISHLDEVSQNVRNSRHGEAL
jgi:hypothetical protein